ncbi:MAG: hypothetical protein IDH49_08765 [Gammaproteobacteria bacterium]|nr:hypothetical protein [Gammaproteobacteria bacterium]
MMFKTHQSLVVTEPDIEDALKHLRSLPFSNPLPKSWDRLRLLSMIRDSIGKAPKVGQLFDIAPGVFGIIKPFGVDLAGQRESDGRLQVWLAVRRVGTDPAHVTEL